MAIIDYAIQPASFELVRERIGAILKDELSNQSTLLGKSYINADVFIERSISMNQTETSMINVSLASGDYGLITAISQDGTYNFDIDIFTKSKTIGNDRGDYLASEKLQRLTGICHHILSHNRYRTLGFAPPFIENVTVSNIKFASPQTEETANLLMSRLSMAVRVPESNNPVTPNLIAGYETVWKINETDLGYKIES